MRLELENGRVIQEPDERALEEALRSLDGEENSFAILDPERGDNSFLQTAGGPDTFVVEYRESLQQFSSESVALETVISLFKACRQGTDSWRYAVPWKNISGKINK